ncbi:hypothetical protein DXT99_01805 [Pontibacter diazotrophicus]|uniref:Uncharacterized protein n=1 Tax=Pontibacter diazotrophicus TaxID=1400979 RepID=A0A3D8LHH0_9BACT|nr:hypothetical protein [Pontibacter diazotrophicus]RDV16873.1 hypothetical protein DXT99_01805 [Pontibacter diazotrophicus]
MDSIQSVPSAPNESIIQGTILDIQRCPEGLGFVWQVKVIESQDVIEYANFATRHIGKEINILIHPELKKFFVVGDKIVAHIFFQGDEKGGAFFLIGDKIEMVKPDPI